MLSGLKFVRYKGPFTTETSEAPEHHFIEQLKDLMQKPSRLDYLPRMICELDNLVRPLSKTTFLGYHDEAYEAALHGSADQFKLAREKIVEGGVIGGMNGSIGLTGL